MLARGKKRRPGPTSRSGAARAPGGVSDGTPGAARGSADILVWASGDRAEPLTRALAEDAAAVRLAPSDLDGLAAALAAGPWDVVLVDAAGDGPDPGRVVALVGAHDPALPVIVTGLSKETEAARLLADGARDALTGTGLARLGAVVARETAVRRLRRDWARVRDAEARLARTVRRQGRAVAAAREAERRRLARELHDELGQSLTAIRLEAGTLARATHDGAAAEAAGRIERLAARVLDLFRARLDDLDPPDLAPFGLMAALRERVAAWEREAGVPCALSVFGAVNDLANGPADDMDRAVQLAAFRVVQEALTNAARHARASRVRIRVGRLPGTLGRGDRLEVSVADDGVGPAPGGADGRGLAGLRRRVAALGGELRVTGGPGTRVTACLPLRGPPEDGR
jgi:signal transduction histidine kinase